MCCRSPVSPSETSIAARERRREIEALSGELGVPLQRIGSVQTGQPRLVVLDAAGKAMQFRGGFDHFGRR